MSDSPEEYEDNVQQQNRLIVIPRSLTTDDGRELLITRWEPVVSLGEMTSVRVTAVLRERAQ